MVGSDTTLIALASAFGGAVVSGAFTLAGGWFNHRNEARREQERWKLQSREKLADIRRDLYGRFLSGAAGAMANPTTDEAVQAFIQAEQVLCLVADEDTLTAAGDLVDVIWRRDYHAFENAKGSFVTAAKKSLGKED